MEKIKNFFKNTIEKIKKTLIKEKTPEQLAKIAEAKAAKEAADLEAFRVRRDRLIKKKLAEIDRYEAKTRKKLENFKINGVKKTKDETEKREIEYFVKKKLEELEKEVDGKRRIARSSTGSRLSYEKKKGLYGYGFIAIWIVGVAFMFIMPLITSITYSLNKTTPVDQNNAAEFGMKSAGIHLEWNNFYNYYRALFVDSKFVVTLTGSLGAMAPQVALVLVFSLFIAILLNQKFKGRTVMRAIFFLPVIIATGPVIGVINGDLLLQGASGGAQQFSTLFKTDLVDGFMQFIGLYHISESFTDFVSNATSDIFNLIWKSGIQILIFLAALQQIPVSAKEAASMEGATGWEFFWKISFPTISPMILANLIYTIIDTFSDSQNPVMKAVVTQIQQREYGYSAAIAWIYFLVIALALAIVVGIVSRFVFYQVE